MGRLKVEAGMKRSIIHLPSTVLAMLSFSSSFTAMIQLRDHS